MSGKKKNIRQILNGIQAMDQVYFDFEKQCTDLLSNEILSFYPNIKLNSVTNDEFKHFANQVFNTAESVIDKDHNYPIYRMRKELFIMKKLADEKDQNNENPALFTNLSKILKKLSIDFFPGIFDLSGNGFRLLDANMNYVIYSFLEWFYTMKNKSVKTQPPHSEL